jgi:hypothetical protein
MAKFVVRKDGKILSFTKLEDIPDVFEHLISFQPDWPKEPHTHEDHEEIAKLNRILQDLIKKENIGCRLPQE